MITATQMDDAIRAAVVRLGRSNLRLVSCSVTSCRKSCPPGTARVLWVDGVHRGYGCPTCTWGLR